MNVGAESPDPMTDFPGEIPWQVWAIVGAVFSAFSFITYLVVW